MIKIYEQKTFEVLFCQLIFKIEEPSFFFNNTSVFVDSYLSLNSQEESIFQSELSTMKLEEKEQIMQITTSWEEKGIEIGIVKGKLEIALRQLNRKLGSLSEEDTDRIKSLESNQLDSLTEDLLDFESFEDLKRWLKGVRI